ncbi:MAG: hypothetical protein ACRYFX_10940 [Janthinobacterium lividum]
MSYLFHLLAAHWHLSPEAYWHLRLVSAVSLVPLLAVLYLVVFGRERPQPRFTRFRYRFAGSRSFYSFSNTQHLALRFSHPA